jgi:uncharacterized membrane protein YgcG
VKKVLAAVAAVVMLAGCSSGHKSKALHSVVYKDDQGQYWCKGQSSNDALIWYILFAQNNSSTSVSSSKISGGTWTASSSRPAVTVDTGRAVSLSKTGEPEEELEDETAVPADEEVTDESTEGQVSSEEDAVTNDNGGDTGDNGGGGDNGGDSGGGDSGGGGDGGGGGD